MNKCSKCKWYQSTGLQNKSLMEDNPSYYCNDTDSKYYGYVDTDLPDDDQKKCKEYR